VDFVDGWHKNLHQGYGWIVDPDQSSMEEEYSSGEESAKFTDLYLKVALGRVPCSQTSHYRLP